MARSGRQKEKTPPQRLILDSGAVIAWSRGEVRTRALLMRALETGADIRIPVAVLAETLRGGARDAPVHRVRNAVDVFPTDERMGRLAGRLLGDAGGTNTVDAMVASEAVLAEADVLTADPGDLRPLLAGFPRIQVIPV
jgi:predicted nucleic acid-binding protein